MVDETHRRIEHVSGRRCQVCEAADGDTFIVEYGWYEDSTSKSTEVESISTRYLPIGEAQTTLCTSCLGRERSKERRRFTMAAIVALCIAVFTGVLVNVQVLAGMAPVHELPLSFDRAEGIVGFLAFAVAVVGFVAAFGAIATFVGLALTFGPNWERKHGFRRAWAMNEEAIETQWKDVDGFDVFYPTGFGDQPSSSYGSSFRPSAVESRRELIGTATKRHRKYNTKRPQMDGFSSVDEYTFRIGPKGADVRDWESGPTPHQPKSPPPLNPDDAHSLSELLRHAEYDQRSHRSDREV